METSKKSKQTGFTIVELLIVIVVIGILAAVVLLAYNGVQNNARIATLQSDLESAYKVLANDNTTTTVYPATLAAANNGQGITPTAGNTYSYTVNNATSPAYYCLAETNTATSLTYYITSNSNTPQAGNCVVTNLETNPSVETNLNGWTVGSWGTGGAGTYSTASDGGASGLSYARMTFTTASTGELYMMVRTVPVTAGLKYTCSASIRASWNTSVTVRVVFFDSTGTWLTQTGGKIIPDTAGTWVRVSSSATATSTAVTLGCILVTPSPTTYPVVGSTFDTDAVMVTQGSVLYTYADGSSPSWSWTGTANASTSTGPPL